MIILYPFSLLLAFVVFVRESLYRFKILPSFKVKTKVLSVGNLTFGGTGKTPSVDFLLQNLKSKKKLAVISRGYGRSTSGFYKVNPNDSNATSLYGDEPVLLATHHPEVSFYVCEDRVQGCRQIEKDGSFDLIIADDAFQHLKLKRDIDVVVIDATEKKQHYNYPPVGRARNSFCYLKRANFVFLTKTNLANSDDLKWIKEKLKNSSVIEFESKIEGYYDLSSGQKIETMVKEVNLISGIGKPHTFEELVQKNSAINVNKHFIFKDHYDYQEYDLEMIQASTTGEVLLTTEKDAVKLKQFSDKYKIAVAKLIFVNKTSLDKLYETIH